MDLFRGLLHELELLQPAFFAFLLDDRFFLLDNVILILVAEFALLLVDTDLRLAGLKRKPRESISGSDEGY
jgi:hypothetical protein